MKKPFSLYSIRMRYARENKMTPDDQLELYGGVNRTIKMLWTKIDRNNYTSLVNTTGEDGIRPIPPAYTLYTGLSLRDTFMVFIGTLALHFTIIFIVKLFTQKWRRNGFKGFFNIMISSFENMNISRPTQDWDQKKTDKYGNQVQSTIDNYKQRFREVKRDLIISYVITLMFSIIFLIPLWYTGEMIN